MNRRLLSGAVAFAIVIGLFANCSSKKKDDSSTNLLLFFLLDQLSGNCASVTKSTGGTVYSATGLTVPKGGCNASTLQTGLYTIDPATAVTAVGTGYDALKAVYDANSSSCSALSTAVTNSKNAVTTTTVTAQQTALTSGNTGCTTVGSGRLDSGKMSNVFICKDTASVTAVKALSSYITTSSVATDMATSLADLKTAATSGTSTTGFTASAIAAMKAYGPTELAVFSGANYNAWITAILNSGVPCAKVIAADASLKSVLASVYGGSLPTATPLTTTDGAAVTAVVTTSLKCGYGSGFTAVPATGLGTASAACPSTYTQF
ncbi:MAG: hypothetical protein K8R21_11190 [Leptospira sp.]|nr:hypothetical protein [Leptospira sp.]